MPNEHPEIRWPKTKTTTELKLQTRKQALRYALRMHVCWAEVHRRNMEWDLYWAEFYKEEIKRIK